MQVNTFNIKPSTLGISIQETSRTLGFMEFVPINTRIDFKESIYNFTTFIKATNLVLQKNIHEQQQQPVLTSWANKLGISVEEFKKLYKLPTTW